MKTELRYLTHDLDRRGNDRYYVRLKINGRDRKKRVRQPFKTAGGEITQDFMVAYWAALAELRGDQAAAKPVILRQDTFNWLFDQYYRSTAFAKMDVTTQRDKRSVLGRFAEKAGDLPFKKYRREDMERSQQARASTPGAADKLVKVLRAVFNWAAMQKPPLMTHNPATGIETINRKKGGFHTWTPDEIDVFRAHLAVGTVPRLAMELMITIGARRSDAAQIGPRNEIIIKGKRCVRFTAHKGRNRHPVEIEARLTDELIASIAATKVGTTAYVLSSRDTPYTIESFGNAFARWCEEAGLPHCSSHGLRKAAAVAYAESEGTAPELMAIFGWSNLRTAQIYIEQASKRRMRANAFDRREEYKKKENVSLLAAEKSNETKEEKKHEKTK
ncbi:tyrosine-type recombinase/integrase [Rhizobium sp. VS19-DR104.2]|uniref:tyrosine-type recombinase/integrase n=1 Tax=unclassified Rhizobium TaxID=2613769 RepID=UPI001CC54EDC|nr:MULTISPECIES: tyrosine-type recombinase/integrase [unclassified Rhizobium]MBZ5761778.1 tyrosine-type recombinase/integrase [Rhizobium sp. VS19-DR96]MBZ5768028.1 tyrosine-type recombinase/integrase [Rhizobium sp. VS19-DR129.2]MBZ5775376.1 tyrosine-type recombinase/integrase [Rhizobium sp. VS19-DRK62.2]MBZ5786657.1 tyrosine-type recombinase/integrase [Rhizobium sp. VS19-DR121]MBZ5803813.1 tyrosine-type recombinase/integrase [Rhizobium sp. VS19-DR181]